MMGLYKKSNMNLNINYKEDDAIFIFNVAELDITKSSVQLNNDIFYDELKEILELEYKSYAKL